MRIAAFILFAFCAAAHAGREPYDCGFLLQKAPAFWKQVRAELRENILHPERLLDLVRLERMELERGMSIGHGATGEVFADKWKGRAVATKVYFRSYGSEDDDKFYNTLAFQKALGDLGISPALLGAYWSPQGEIGIVMERIEAVSSFRYVDETPKRRLKRQAVTIRSQIFQLSEVLKSLQILPHDLQCLVCRDGKIYLHDFDAYTYDPISPNLDTIVRTKFGFLLDKLTYREEASWGYRILEWLHSIGR